MNTIPIPPRHPPPFRVAAVIVAGGRGLRSGGGRPKQFRDLAGRPLLAWSVGRLAVMAEVAQLVVVVPEGWEAEAGGIVAAAMDNLVSPPPWRLATGGSRRQDSVRAGVADVDPAIPWVAVHDAARPFVPTDLSDLWRAAAATGAAILAAPVTDSLRRGAGGLLLPADGDAAAALDRDGLWAAQTPQVARRIPLLAALADADAAGVEVTDEAAALVRAGIPVAIVPGPRSNFKLTTPDDWGLAEAIAHASTPTTAEGTPP